MPDSRMQEAPLTYWLKGFEAEVEQADVISSDDVRRAALAGPSSRILPEGVEAPVDPRLRMAEVVLRLHLRPAPRSWLWKSMSALRNLILGAAPVPPLHMVISSPADPDAIEVVLRYVRSSDGRLIPDKAR